MKQLRNLKNVSPENTEPTFLTTIHTDQQAGKSTPPD